MYYILGVGTAIASVALFLRPNKKAQIAQFEKNYVNRVKVYS